MNQTGNEAALRSEWESLLTDHGDAFAAQQYSAPVLHPDQEARITINGACYWHLAEDFVLRRVADLHVEYAAILMVRPGLTGILLDAWHGLQHMQLSTEIDDLYRRLFGHCNAEIELQRPTDRNKALAKLEFLTEVITMERALDGRL